MNQVENVPLKWLLTASFINNFAFGFIWPLTSVYLHDGLYQTMITVGWVLFANSLMQMVGSLLSGRLFDRFSPRTLLRTGVMAMLVVMAALIFWHGWPVYPYLLAVSGFINGWLTAIMNAYGTRVTARDGRFVFNMLYFIANFGMVFGTALVGPVYGFGVTWLFVFAFILYIVLLIIVRTTLNMDLTVAAKTMKQAVVKFKLPRWNSLLIWTLIFGLVGLHLAYVQWQANLSVYMSGYLQMPLWQYSILWTINGVLIAVIQLSMNALNISASKRAMFIQIFAGLLFFGIAFLILPFATNFSTFVIAMVITTFGEATAFPMLPALVNELTPLSLKGRYQGLMAAAPNLGRAVGPLLGGIVIDYSGYHELFYAAAGVAFLAFILVAVVVIIGYRHTTQYGLEEE